MHYNILHDQQKTLTFVGNTFHNSNLYNNFKQIRPCEKITLEQAQDQSTDWYKQRQFMCAVTNISFKKLVVETLNKHNVKWFSVVHSTNCIQDNVTIGKNTLINYHNVISEDATIGDHVTISNFCNLSHNVFIGDMCHLSPYVYLCFTTLLNGVCVGLRSSFPGKPTSPMTIAEWTNILMESRITKSLDQSGTYAGNRCINSELSHETKIL